MWGEADGLCGATRFVYERNRYVGFRQRDWLLGQIKKIPKKYDSAYVWEPGKTRGRVRWLNKQIKMLKK